MSQEEKNLNCDVKEVDVKSKIAHLVNDVLRVAREQSDTYVTLCKNAGIAIMTMSLFPIQCATWLSTFAYLAINFFLTLTIQVSLIASNVHHSLSQCNIDMFMIVVASNIVLQFFGLDSYFPFLPGLIFSTLINMLVLAQGDWSFVPSTKVLPKKLE
jgi:hypothetical protein